MPIVARVGGNIQIAKGRLRGALKPNLIDLRQRLLLIQTLHASCGSRCAVNGRSRIEYGRMALAGQLHQQANLVMDNMETTHHALIVDQFTRQAKPFSAVLPHSAEDSLQLLEDTIQVNAEDEILDVACGPGIVSCWLARKAKRVTGADLVPAMLDQARRRQADASLNNLQWSLADADHLPFSENSFTCVVTRYSFHHLLDPRQTLREMARVCRPGGRIAVVDVTPDEGKSAAYDAVETLRDPSHTHALPLQSLLALGAEEKLPLVSTASYRLEIPLEAELAASFPAPGDAEIVRAMIRRDLGVDRLSVGAIEINNEIVLRFPISIAVWTKPQ